MSTQDDLALTDPLQGLQQYILRTRDVIHDHLGQCSSPRLREAWPDWRVRLERLHAEAREEPQVTVSLVGTVGAGKSTLINALLGERIVPTGSAGACTSAVCEVGYAADGQYLAEVEFLSRDQWEQEVIRLREELNLSLQAEKDPTADRDPGRQHPTGAWQKLVAIYQLDREADRGEVLARELVEPDAIRDVLDVGRIRLTEATGKKLHDCIRTYLTSSGPFWPIVRRVRVSGPFEVLRSGVTLIDLPGVNDPNPAREQITRNHLKNCKWVWVLFNVKRSLTRDLFELMRTESLFREMLFDGKTSRLTFVGTATDDLHLEDALTEFNLDDDAPIPAVLKARRDAVACGVRETLHDLATRLASDAQEQGSAVQRLQQRLATPRLFTVSAVDYLNLCGNKRPKLIDLTELTEVPALRQHVEQIGQEFGLSHHIRQLRREVHLVQESVEAEQQTQAVRLNQSLEMTNRTREEVRREFEQALRQLDGCLQECRGCYQGELENAGLLLAQRFAQAFERGRQEVQRTVTRWAAIAWNTLLAICRARIPGQVTTSKGAFDLPQELADPVLNTVVFAWDDYFGDRLLTIVRQGHDRLTQAAKEYVITFRAIVARRLQRDSALRQSSERMLRTMGQVFVEQREQDRGRIAERITEVRSTLYERIPARIRKAMRPAFEAAAKESGTGMRERMIANHLRPAAQRIAAHEFTLIQQDIEGEVRGLQAMLLRAHDEMIDRVKQLAETAANSFWQEARELSTEAIDQELKALTALGAALRQLRRQ